MPNYAGAVGAPAALGFTASAAITGGQLVRLSGPGQVAPTLIDNDFSYAGVAAHDAKPGDPVTVLCGAGIIHESRATAATITAGAALEASIAGVVAPLTTGPLSTAYQVGYAVTNAGPGPFGPATIRWLAFR